MTDQSDSLSQPDDQFKKLEADFRDTDGAIPFAPEPEVVAPPGAAAKSSLLDVKEDKCPNCGAGMKPDAVVCFKCGYDQNQGRVVKAEVGVVEVEEEKGRPEYVTVGRGSPKTVSIAGGALLAAAMVTAGVNAPAQSWSVVAAMVALVLFRTILHTGTGVIGVWIAARVAENRFTHVDLAGARMFTAVAIFQFCCHLALPIEYQFVSKIAVFALAVGAYWLTLFFFFRKDHRETSVLLLCHLAVAAFVEFGVLVEAYLQSVTVTTLPGK